MNCRFINSNVLRYSSFANCAIDDFYAKLKKMKHPKDGSVSELFPDSPENLFFYTSKQDHPAVN